MSFGDDTLDPSNTRQDWAEREIERWRSVVRRVEQRNDKLLARAEQAERNAITQQERCGLLQRKLERAIAERDEACMQLVELRALHAKGERALEGNGAKQLRDNPQPEPSDYAPRAADSAEAGAVCRHPNRITEADEGDLPDYSRCIDCGERAEAGVEAGPHDAVGLQEHLVQLERRLDETEAERDALRQEVERLRKDREIIRKDRDWNTERANTAEAKLAAASAEEGDGPKCESGAQTELKGAFGAGSTCTCGKTIAGQLRCPRCSR